MTGELKSTLDLIMERLGGEGQQTLTEEQKREISEVRRTYQAKMAEARIMLKGDENLPRELARLEREMEEKVELIKTRKTGS
ncbi:MAG: hypothetical protein ACUVS3_11310 [Thermodesulfobacteriota bacterium]